MHQSKQARAEWVWSYMQLGARKPEFSGMMIYAHNQSIVIKPSVILSFCPYCISSSDSRVAVGVATYSAMAITSSCISMVQADTCNRGAAVEADAIR